MKKPLILALLALSGALFAASQEVDELDRKTADALNQAEVGHPASVEAMNKSYLAALQKLEAERQKDGDLKQLLMVRDDLKSFNETLEIRKGSSFPRLQFLRDAYLKQFHRLQAQRLEKRLALLEGHRTALVALQKKLTRSDLIPEALEVEKALEVCDPKIEKARGELKTWMEVKPERAIKELSKAGKEEGAETEPKHREKTPAPRHKDPEKTAAETVPAPVPEPAKEPASPFDAPPEPAKPE